MSYVHVVCLSISPQLKVRVKGCSIGIERLGMKMTHVECVYSRQANLSEPEQAPH